MIAHEIEKASECRKEILTRSYYNAPFLPRFDPTYAGIQIPAIGDDQTRKPGLSWIQVTLQLRLDRLRYYLYFDDFDTVDLFGDI